MKRQSSIITIPELGMPWLASGAHRRVRRIGWLGRVKNYRARYFVSISLPLLVRRKV
jgi:hypothetical protein